MRVRPLASFVVALACLASTPGRGRADDPGGAATTTNGSPGIKNSLWQPVFQSMAEDYQISPAEDRDRHFKLLLPPVFRWTQPVRGGDDGALFVWLDGAA